MVNLIRRTGRCAKGIDQTWLYHATRYGLLDPISREGLHSGTYYTELAGVELWFSYACGVEGALAGVPVVLRVARRRVGHLTVDRAGTKDAGAPAYTAARHVLPRVIEVWTASDWVPVSRYKEVAAHEFWAEVEDGCDVTDSALLP